MKAGNKPVEVEAGNKPVKAKVEMKRQEVGNNLFGWEMWFEEVGRRNTKRVENTLLEKEVKDALLDCTRNKVLN